MRAALAKGISSLYLVHLLSFPLSIATNLVAGRCLSPADYGAYATATFVVALLSMVCEANLVQALVRHPDPVSDDEYASVFVYQLSLATSLAAIIVVCASLVGVFFHEYGETARMIRWLALTPILSSFLTVPLAKMERELRYGKLSVLTLIWSYAERGLLIALMLAQFRGFSYAYARIAGVFLQAILLVRVARWNPFAMFGRVLANGWKGRTHLRFGYTLLLKDAANPLITGIVPGLGARLFDASTVGLIAWGQNLSSMIGLQLPQFAGRVLMGASSQLKREDLGEYLNEVLLVCTAFTATSLGILAATLPEILRFLFNPKWIDAAPFFALSSMVVTISILHIVYDAVMVMIGKPGVSVKANWSWGIASFLICWIWGHFGGPYGLVYGQIVGVFVPVILLHIETRKHCRLHLARNFALPVAMGGAFAILTFALKGRFVHGLPSLILYGAVAGILGLIAQAATQPRLVNALRDLRRLRVQSQS